jgi:hypothetical protein
MDMNEQKSAEAHMEAALDYLKEHFDSIQIIATRHDDETGLTHSLRRGRGNYYARLAACREWVDGNQAKDRQDWLPPILVKMDEN